MSHRFASTRPSAPAALAAALTLAALAAAAPAAAHDAPPQPAITVQGDAEVRRVPDEATVRLGVVAQEPNAQAAQASANRIAQAILAAVRDLDIPDTAIQTSRLVLYPVYSQPPRTLSREEDFVPEIVAYTASNTVSVRVEDLTKVGPVVDAGIGAGANQVEGVDFRLRDDTAARAEALQAAVAEARGEAEAIARALGVALGPVLAADEGSVRVAYPGMERAAFAMDVPQAAPTPVAPGDITVTASVTVRYGIAGRE